jgi:hypothetical protein
MAQCAMRFLGVLSHADFATLQANVGPVIGQSEEEGARALIYAATSPDMEGAQSAACTAGSGSWSTNRNPGQLWTFRARRSELVVC